MTTVVLLVLAIVWGVLLVSWLRSRSESTFSDSVGTFRRHLTVLERAAPSTVVPANRLRSGPVAGRGGIPAFRPPANAIRGHGFAPAGRPVPNGRVAPLRGVPSPNSLRRRQVQKRRRDVFFALLAGVVGSFLLAIIPGLSIMWSVQVMFDLLFVGYLVVLIRMRNAAAERELKLTFMPQQRIAAPKPKPTYDFGGAAYGELGLHRAAN